MKKIIGCYIIFLFGMLMWAEDVKIFFTNTYMVNTIDLSKELNKNKIVDMYSGISKTEYNSEINYPTFIETEDSLYGYNKFEYLKVKKNKIKCNEYGFLYFTFNDNIQYIIYGGNYYAIKYNNFSHNEDKRINEVGEIFHNVFNSDRYNPKTGELQSSDIKLNEDWGNYASQYLDYSLFLYNIVKSIKMNVPFLEESINGKKITYNDDILKFRWFLITRYGSLYANCVKPMVEGDRGNGIGVEVDIEFYIPSDNIVILNGYADWNKQHLYKQNARMKKVKVEGDGFSLDYEFEDYVHFAQIDFPKQVDKIKITVLEVYDGSKWADMAISGIWVNPDVNKTANLYIATEYLKYATQHCVEINE